MFSFFSFFGRNSGGYVTLVAVLIVSGIATLIATSGLLSALDFSRTNSNFEASTYARVLSYACTEEALLQIQQSQSYSGFGSLSFDQSSCSYLVENSGGSIRTITASSTVLSAVSRVRTIVDQLSPRLRVSSSEEYVL